jgi:O-phospho-L-seryl-tRNASec:L-selenocysteinyl-tRNA synthase
MLFSRCVSGTRTVPTGRTEEVGGVRFQGYGAHHDAYPVAYLTAAATLGTTREDVDDFCARLAKTFAEARRRASKAAEGG